MIDARALLIAMLDAIEQDEALRARVRNLLGLVDGTKLVTRDEAARALGIERKAISAMIASGALQSRRVGRRVLVTVDDVRAAIEARATKPASAPEPIEPAKGDPAYLRALRKAKAGT